MLFIVAKKKQTKSEKPTKFRLLQFWFFVLFVFCFRFVFSFVIHIIQHTILPILLGKKTIYFLISKTDWKAYSLIKITETQCRFCFNFFIIFYNLVFSNRKHVLGADISSMRTLSNSLLTTPFSLILDCFFIHILGILLPNFYDLISNHWQ